MKHILTAAIALTSISAISAQAEVDFYGKANVTFELVSEDAEDHTALNSNASRLGVKGSESLTDALTAIYQLEYEVDVDAGDDVFKQRNIYVGLKGDFGSVIAGHFDTPFKRAQKKIDIFNDLHGDIKHVITNSDLRGSNSLMYVTPKMLDSVNVYVQYISSESEEIDPGVSLAVTYSAGDLYLAAAVDSDVQSEGSEAVRFVAQYTLDRLLLGLLVEQYEGASTESETGWSASAQYNITDKWAAKFQAGTSDIKYTGGETLSLGADYKFSKTTKVFGYYTLQGADDDISGNPMLDNDYLGVGIDVKF